MALQFSWQGLQSAGDGCGHCGPADPTHALPGMQGVWKGEVKILAQNNQLAVAACTNAKCEVHRVTVTAYPFIPSNLCCPACREALGDAVVLDHASLTQQGFGMTT